MNYQLFTSRKATDARAGKGEPIEKLVRRLTHLRLQDCNITEIAELEACRKLQVLYLNSNRIRTLQGLQHASLKSLLQLDLHDNDISVMEGLGSLTGLRRLSLARNSISYVAGLEGLTLQSLDISGQRTSTEVDFCPMTIGALARSLEQLNCAGNRLTHVEHLACLDRLEVLDISNNAIAEIEAFGTGLLALVNPSTGQQRQLRKLTCSGNPCMDPSAGAPRPHEKIILMGAGIRNLNGKDVDARQRDFMVRLEKRKLMPKKKNPQGSGGAAAAGGSVLMPVQQVRSQRPLAFEEGNQANISAYAQARGRKRITGRRNFR
eukprot:g2698.t1